MRPATAPPLAHARRFAWPTPDLYRIDSLTDDDLRACWEFRRGFMDLKPRVDPANDWKKYVAWIRTADFVWLPRDPDGRLRSTLFYKVEVRRHEGRAAVLIWPEYGYSRPDARKSAGYIVGALAALGLGAARAPGKPMYMVGTGYLPSYMSLCQLTGKVYLAEEPSTTAWERSLYRALAAETGGYDAVTGVVDMGTIPRDPRTAPPSDPALLGPWRRYMDRNPRWTEGYTCLLFARWEPAVMTSAARLIAGRRRPPS